MEGVRKANVVAIVVKNVVRFGAFTGTPRRIRDALTEPCDEVFVHALVRSGLPQMAGLCHRYGVRRLSLFGSALGDAFDENQSDIDVLVEFEIGPTFDGYFSLKEKLEAHFDRSVDVVTLPSVRNPYLRAQIVGTARCCTRLTNESQSTPRPATPPTRPRQFVSVRGGAERSPVPIAARLRAALI